MFTRRASEAVAEAETGADAGRFPSRLLTRRVSEVVAEAEAAAKSACNLSPIGSKNSEL